MDWEALSPLGQGCTSPDYVCPVLDRYRARVGGPPTRIPQEVRDAA